jgi:toxin YoeB
LKLIFSERGWNDYLHWQDADKTVNERINQLIKEIRRSPFVGIGRPEPLVGNYKGFWSRRITQEHRMVYRVSGSGEAQAIEIAACRFHYDK